MWNAAPMSETIVREARPQDVEGLLALYEELADRPSAAGAGATETLTVLESMLADPARHLLVAQADGELLGTVDLLIAANLTHRAAPWAAIENVVVAARARRRGVGAALMRRAFQIAAAAGCYKVQLLSGRQRVEAHAFYRELGMESIAEGFKLYFADPPIA